MNYIHSPQNCLFLIKIYNNTFWSLLSLPTPLKSSLLPYCSILFLFILIHSFSVSRSLSVSKQKKQDNQKKNTHTHKKSKKQKTSKIKKANMKQKVHKNTIGFVVCWPAPCSKVLWYTQWVPWETSGFPFAGGSQVICVSSIRSVLKLESLIQYFVWHTVLTLWLRTAFYWVGGFFLPVWVWVMELRCHRIVCWAILQAETLLFLKHSHVSVCT